MILGMTTRPPVNGQYERAVEVAESWAQELPEVDAKTVPVVWLVKAVARGLLRERERVLRALGIDAATLDLLSTLRRAGDPYMMTPRELAQQCLVTAAAISQRLARAEQQEFIERYPLDGRSVGITLTQAGHQMVERCAAEVIAADATLCEGLDASDVTELEHLLSRWLSGMS